MKRIALWTLILTMTAGVLAGSATALDPLSGEKTIFEGERMWHGGGHHPGRPPGWHRPPPPPRPGHHGGFSFGWSWGRPSYPAYPYVPMQPTLVCDIYGNCYYQYPSY